MTERKILRNDGYCSGTVYSILLQYTVYSTKTLLVQPGVWRQQASLFHSVVGSIFKQSEINQNLHIVPSNLDFGVKPHRTLYSIGVIDVLGLRIGRVEGFCFKQEGV